MGSGALSAKGLDRMREIMAGHVADREVPGLVTLISRRGDTHAEAFGTMAFDSDVPIRRDTIFRIASMTKPVAAVAAMILVEECRLRLDAPVDPFLPELADRRVLRRLDGPLDDTVPAARPISLRDLLTMRLGIGYNPDVSEGDPIQAAIHELGLAIGPEPAAGASPEEWIGRLAALPLMHQPGERWLYETGYDVLGVLIARAAGQPLETFLRERIFDPLGMTDTGFSVPADQLDRLPPCYLGDPQTGELALFDAAPDSRWSRPPGFPSASGGLVSTVDDYLAFGRMLFANGTHGGVRILARPSVELMTTDHLSPEQRAEFHAFGGEPRGWGLGVSIVTRRDDVSASPGRFGWDGGLGTSWGSDPAEDLIAILMTQRLVYPAPTAIYADFWTSAYAAIDD